MIGVMCFTVSRSGGASDNGNGCIGHSGRIDRNCGNRETLYRDVSGNVPYDREHLQDAVS